MIRKKNVNLSFSEQKKSQRGVFSVLLGILSLVAAIVLIIISYTKQGNAGAIVGACGIVAVVTAIIGVIFSVLGARETEVNRMPAYIGFVLNIIILVVWVSMFTIGM